MPIKYLIAISSLNGQLTENKNRKAIIIWLIQYFEADFLWKVSLKIRNSGIFLNNLTHIKCYQMK